VGHEKVGKTFNLIEWSIFAAKSRCNVIFFAVGDMSEHQMIQRYGIRLTGRSNKLKYCNERICPIPDCRLNQQDKCANRNRSCRCGVGFEIKFDNSFNLVEKLQTANRNYIPCTYCKDRNVQGYEGAIWFALAPQVEPMSGKDLVASGETFMKRMVGKDYKLATYSNSSINIQGIISHLDMLEITEGFIPDVIFIDYADILAPETLGVDRRDQHDERFRALRRLSQDRHCCVVTATQSNSEAYKQMTLNLRSYSEDKRKNAHVTVMAGLNQTDVEKIYGIMRYNIIAAREGESSSLETVTVLQCLPRGRVFLDTFWTPTELSSLGRMLNLKKIENF